MSKIEVRGVCCVLGDEPVDAEVAEARGFLGASTRPRCLTHRLHDPPPPPCPQMPKRKSSIASSGDGGQGQPKRRKGELVTLVALPVEVLLLIMRLLGVGCLVSLQKTCKLLNDIAMDRLVYSGCTIDLSMVAPNTFARTPTDDIMEHRKCIVDALIRRFDGVVGITGAPWLSDDYDYAESVVHDYPDPLRLFRAWAPTLRDLPLADVAGVSRDDAVQIILSALSVESVDFPRGQYPTDGVYAALRRRATRIRFDDSLKHQERRAKDVLLAFPALKTLEVCVATGNDAMEIAWGCGFTPTVTSLAMDFPGPTTNNDGEITDVANVHHEEVFDALPETVCSVAIDTAGFHPTPLDPAWCRLAHGTIKEGAVATSLPTPEAGSLPNLRKVSMLLGTSTLDGGMAYPADVAKFICSVLAAAAGNLETLCLLNAQGTEHVVHLQTETVNTLRLAGPALRVLDIPWLSITANQLAALTRGIPTLEAISVTCGDIKDGEYREAVTAGGPRLRAVTLFHASSLTAAGVVSAAAEKGLRVVGVMRCPNLVMSLASHEAKLPETKIEHLSIDKGNDMGVKLQRLLRACPRLCTLNLKGNLAWGLEADMVSRNTVVNALERAGLPRVAFNIFDM